MASRLPGLTGVDPLAVPLPHGTDSSAAWCVPEAPASETELEAWLVQLRLAAVR